MKPNKPRLETELYNLFFLCKIEIINLLGVWHIVGSQYIAANITDISHNSCHITCGISVNFGQSS